jgi:hypothetical protein
MVGNDLKLMDMKAEILEIITQHKYEHISSEQAVSELFDLFAISKRHLIESILEDMNNKHSEYHREIVESYLDDGC